MSNGLQIGGSGGDDDDEKNEEAGGGPRQRLEELKSSNVWKKLDEDNLSLKWDIEKQMGDGQRRGQLYKILQLMGGMYQEVQDEFSTQ